ncbi:hypothetical protein [Allomuricauda sp. SCSIO 65647]|uniref:hypothetical protein n=1 Tax=Allomuricauda sp. SCSIO 65647 TaxID=2908843 RepID=UPI001F2377C3|nr:hypothetical protein [Muricauda sp. SCSIO 65647]UJH68661.1 hypothetical protein L0P89_05460 [Muricauda sp. SCSIO 65647]
MRNFILLFFITSLGLSQEVTRLQEYLPPSPEAQEFIKYGEYPVSMFTGVPNITIPLHTITAKEIQIPISLSYHASGIQVDQIASWAGLGWSLSTGGTISKIPRGIPDDAGKGFLVSTLPELSALTFDHYFYEEAATGIQDTESDIYYYNFAGYSGKFFFDRGKNVRLIDQAPIDISYSAGGFTIVTKEGTTFEFNDIERTQSITTSIGNPTGAGTQQNYVSTWHLSKVTSRNKIDIIDYTYELGNSFLANQYSYSESTGSDVDMSTCPPSLLNNVHDGGGSQISSQTQTTQIPKRLTEISFPNGKIVLNRVADRQDVSPDRLEEIEIMKKNGMAYEKIKSYRLIHDHFYSSHATVYPINPTASRRYRLKLIELHELDKNGNNPKKHIFGYNSTMLPPIETNGKDFWGYYNGKNTNINLIPLQPITYFGNSVGAADRNPDADSMKAGVLNKITYPTGGYTEFFYEPHEYVTTETIITSKKQSVFAVGLPNVIGGGVYLEDTKVFTPNNSGYATVTIEASDRSSTTGVYPRVTLQRAGSSGYMIDHSISPTTYSYPLNPPEVNISFPPVWLDQGVAYTLKAEAEGTSNSNEFDGAAYMRAEIDYFEETTSPTPVTKIAGGLRLQQIKSFIKSNELAFSKRYEYNSSTLLTPETFLKEQYLDASIVGFKGPCPNLQCASASTTRRFYYGGTVQSLTLNSGSPVVYGSVDEIMIDGSNNGLGKTNYTYAIQTDDILPVVSSYQGGIMLLKKDWLGGQNTSKTTFKENSIDYTTQEINGYTLKKYDESYKMYKIVHEGRIFGTCMPIDLNGDAYNRFDIIEYPVFTGAKLISSMVKKTKEDAGNEIVVSTSIYYDNETHLQPTREETVLSNGNMVNTEIFYPDDVVNTSSLGSPNISSAEKTVIDRLKQGDLHQVALPLQTITSVKNSGGTILSKNMERTLYTDLGNDLVLPESIKTLKGDYSATTNDIDDRIKYEEYDANGNPLEVYRIQGPSISYIWGYNDQLPIAKIENASYSDIAAALSISVASLKGYDESNMAQINALRSNSNLQNAMVTTYTYDPLVGVTSTTDPRGYTMYYEYDEFNRLKAIKDKDNNLVEEYKYNYKTQ